MNLEVTPLSGLTINMSRLDELGEHYERAGTRGGLGVAVVSEEVLAETKRTECNCEDPRHMARRRRHPLRVGMPASALGDLEEGCKGIPVIKEDGSEMNRMEVLNHPGGWVCNRLIAVRRRYGR